MINSTQIKEKALKLWKSFLQSIITGEDFFPLSIQFAKPTAGEALKNFALLDKWIQELKDNSKDNRGYGYTVGFSCINNRQIGKQNIPDTLCFETEKDYLKYTGLTQEAEIFKNTYRFVYEKYPLLNEWALKYPQKLIDYSAVLPDLCKVTGYFINNPKPGIYTREINAGVHSKFIENYSTILREMLDILIEEHINTGETEFEKRFNLKYPEPLIRMKILDTHIANHFFSGLTDLSITVSEFSELSIPVKNVIIIENKTSFSNILNFLTLPELKNTIALFGKGFGVTLCGRAQWLHNATIQYWGDIDPHGFIILSNFRKYFPETTSVMMDNETFETFYPLAVEGEVVSKYRDLRLTADETALFERLNCKGTINRLEQEFISYEYAVKKLLMH
ncbi:MAG: hypothetical protein A2015_02125 [Spirochaetes bacterium GWF1_31_7]|nr:MAG: hypothetical protein A2Y30_11990 [Spirochaetes bacterium GWE1_32_154]OHD44688.1 MAG: hypothetical protein A2Y29_05825 [Spirochaetes bacterium GWE2_31_10]OHD47060.1 MAG: hypothetical protein A2015_02125 [Spirochaetes bacterium GWF1_31_7]OHD74902.1 MAG: hypothetical protein A2355_00015 [Spirochaetes bacterium RIFOXYB1_FULL_32_8]